MGAGSVGGNSPSTQPTWQGSWAVRHGAPEKMGTLQSAVQRLNGWSAQTDSPCPPPQGGRGAQPWESWVEGACDLLA